MDSSVRSPRLHVQDETTVYIQVETPDGKKRQVPLWRSTVIVGRSPRSSQLVVDDARVSRVHLQLKLTQDGRLLVTDMRSANGTRLNGALIPPHRAQEWRVGDVVEIGGSRLVALTQDDLDDTVPGEPAADTQPLAPPGASAPAPVLSRPVTPFFLAEATAGFAAPSVEVVPQYPLPAAPDRARLVPLAWLANRPEVQYFALTRFLAVGYAGALLVAEAVTISGSPDWGAFLYSVLFLLLLAHAVLNNADTERQILLGLVCVPVARLLGLGLPMLGLSPFVPYLVIAAALLAAVIFTVRALPITWADIGLSRGNWLLQTVIALTGIAFGFVAANVFRLPGLVVVPTESLALAALLVFVGTALPDTLVYRGVLQHGISDAFGGWWAVLYVAVLYAGLHLGFGSAPYVAFVFGVSLFYGWAVQQSRTVLGVALSHGLLNVMLLVVMPALARGG